MGTHPPKRQQLREVWSDLVDDIAWQILHGAGKPFELRGQLEELGEMNRVVLPMFSQAFVTEKTKILSEERSRDAIDAWKLK